MSGAEGDVEVRIASLHLHPVKSCGGIAVDEALVIETGFEFDRAWAVVDERGVGLGAGRQELRHVSAVANDVGQQEVQSRQTEATSRPHGSEELRQPSEKRDGRGTKRAD